MPEEAVRVCAVLNIVRNGHHVRWLLTAAGALRACFPVVIRPTCGVHAYNLPQRPHFSTCSCAASQWSGAHVSVPPQQGLSTGAGAAAITVFFIDISFWVTTGAAGWNDRTSSPQSGVYLFAHLRDTERTVTLGVFRGPFEEQPALSRVLRQRCRPHELRVCFVEPPSFASRSPRTLGKRW
jgi:hypothetical protein